MFLVKCFHYYLHLDASSLISVTSLERLSLGVQVTTLPALSAIFDSTTIVELSLGVGDLKTVSKKYHLLNTYVNIINLFLNFFHL